VALGWEATVEGEEATSVARREALLGLVGATMVADHVAVVTAGGAMVEATVEAEMVEVAMAVLQVECLAVTEVMAALEAVDCTTANRRQRVGYVPPLFRCPCTQPEM